MGIGSGVKHFWGSWTQPLTLTSSGVDFLPGRSSSRIFVHSVVTGPFVGVRLTPYSPSHGLSRRVSVDRPVTTPVGRLVPLSAVLSSHRAVTWGRQRALMERLNCTLPMARRHRSWYSSSARPHCVWVSADRLPLVDLPVRQNIYSFYFTKPW